jgi:hypothetical protein
VTRAACVLATSLGAATAAAAPNLSAPRPSGPLTIYPDDRRPDVFYYGPGEIVLETHADGRPKLTLLQVRYTGTASAGTKGAIAFRSRLTFDVRQTGVDPQALVAVRAAAGIGRSAELRPLPIQRLQATLVHPSTAPPPPGAPAPTDPAPAGDEGHFETSESEAPSPSWSRRTFVLALDATEAQLLGDTLRKGRLLLSLDYAFYARSTAVRSVQPEPDVLVRAGTAAIAIDALRWPDLLRQVDVNEQVPPGYAALDVYCYDFHDALRPDLYEKQVEIEADGVGGRPVVASTTFGRTEPDLYARSLRFPVGVRLDRPYRFRISETALDGRVRAGAWRTVASWDHILDVTSAPALPSRPSPEDQP